MDTPQLKETIAQNLRAYEARGIGGDDRLLSLYAKTPEEQKPVFWETLGQEIAALWDKKSSFTEQMELMLDNAAEFIARLAPSEAIHPAAKKSFGFLMDLASPSVIEKASPDEQHLLASNLSILQHLQFGDADFWNAQYRFWLPRLSTEIADIAASGAFNVSVIRKIELSGISAEELEDFFKVALAVPKDNVPAIEAFSLLVRYASAACPGQKTTCSAALTGHVQEIFGSASGNIPESDHNLEDMRQVLDTWAQNPFNLG
jgi:hypothetical protein